RLPHRARRAALRRGRDRYRVPAHRRQALITLPPARRRTRAISRAHRRRPAPRPTTLRHGRTCPVRTGSRTWKGTWNDVHVVRDAGGDGREQLPTVRLSAAAAPGRRLGPTGPGSTGSAHRYGPPPAGTSPAGRTRHTGRTGRVRPLALRTTGAQLRPE